MYLKEYLDHVYAVKLPVMDKQNLLLSKYCIGAEKKIDYKTEMLMYRDYTEPPPRLNFEHYSKSIWTLINGKSFFKRFVHLRLPQDRVNYEKIIKRGEVELYAKE